MEKILIIGAGGQIGVELTERLREIHGVNAVIPTDLKDQPLLSTQEGPFYILDVMDTAAVEEIIKKEAITQVYLLAAILSATGEKNPMWAWDINMNSLLSILELVKKYKVGKLYWPSSIAAFGPTTPSEQTPQHTILEPTTVYGISKYTGELWCQYYKDKYGLDIRSLRYPGLISWKAAPGGGTTDYAIEIYWEALKNKKYTSFLSQDTSLPMMYMEDAIRATIELMEAPKDQLKTKMAYNLSSMSFTPKDIANSIKKHIPEFEIDYAPDFRQEIADSWPGSIDDTEARAEWNWKHEYDLDKMTETMLHHIKIQLEKAEA
ncbi:MAG TPA: NAD-dependent epimerase/dehydratase family protein [Chitinophagaceae bacterium]|nr:NAD-dependent epimerase/dehydratase family protein [Chitinophagaceae bacterium]